MWLLFVKGLHQTLKTEGGSITWENLLVFVWILLMHTVFIWGEIQLPACCLFIWVHTTPGNRHHAHVRLTGMDMNCIFSGSKAKVLRDELLLPQLWTCTIHIHSLIWSRRAGHQKHCLLTDKNECFSSSRSKVNISGIHWSQLLNCSCYQEMSEMIILTSIDLNLPFG